MGVGEGGKGVGLLEAPSLGICCSGSLQGLLSCPELSCLWGEPNPAAANSLPGSSGGSPGAEGGQGSLPAHSSLLNGHSRN